MAGALTAAIAAAFSGGAAVVTDPYFEYTTLLLPGNGTNGAQNNTFLDGSTNNFTITRNGNTTQGTFSPFSQTGWGNYFDGTGDSIYASSANTANAMGTGDWTIEASVYKTNSTEGYVFDTLALTGASTDAIRIAISSSGAVYFYKYSALATSGGSIALNTWNHIAVVRQSQTIKIYLNGTQVNTTYSDTGSNYTCGTNRPLVGINGYDIASDPFQGYISNLRAVKGVAVYTGNFTPPTSPLAATQSAGTNISAITGTQTSLLTCQSNRFIDNSTNNFTITRNGDTRVVAFSPFNPTASWSAATNGGSGYFDGSGDYLSVADSAAFTMGSGDFTIEAWVYKTSTGRQYVIGQADSGGSNTATSFTLQVNASNKVQGEIFSSSTQYLAASTADIVLNQWNHIAFVRDGNTLRIYINGAQDGTASVTGVSVNDSTNQLAIGRLGEFNGFYWVGYISSNRLLKGTCLYPNGTTFTPPTAPLTAITNTSLLLNFTNAGVYDATSKLVLETVNSASLSNAIAPKWGSTSIKFASSTSDYLWSNNQPAQVEVIGTSDFTIEGWVYLSTINTAFGIISRGTSTTGWSVNITSGNKLQFSYTASSLVGATSLVQNTWYYFAVVRSGSASGNLKLYLSTGGAISSADATSAGAVTDNFNQTNAIYVGADRVGTSLLNGYLQDIRLTNYARTITAAPTAAFPTL